MDNPRLNGLIHHDTDAAHANKYQINVYVYI